ncbi:hypothetical protein QOT17_024535 [Balamuthia mandrillaris]
MAVHGRKGTSALVPRTAHLSGPLQHFPSGHSWQQTRKPVRPKHRRSMRPIAALPNDQLKQRWKKYAHPKDSRSPWPIAALPTGHSQPQRRKCIHPMGSRSPWPTAAPPTGRSKRLNGKSSRPKGSPLAGMPTALQLKRSPPQRMESFGMTAEGQQACHRRQVLAATARSAWGNICKM